MFPQLSTCVHDKQGSFSIRACLDWRARKQDAFEIWERHVGGWVEFRCGHIKPEKLKSSKLCRFNIWFNKPPKHNVHTETLNTLNVHFCSWKGSCCVHFPRGKTPASLWKQTKVGHHMVWGIAEVWEILFCLHFTFLLENYPPTAALGSPQGQSAQDCVRQRETRQVVEKPLRWPKQAKKGHIW